MKPFKLPSRLALIFCLVLGWTGCSSTSNAGGNPPPIVPANDFIYVANAAGAPSTVSGFTTDRATGALTEIPGSPYNAGSSSTALTADPAGKFLFVANYSSGDISVFSINASTGALTSVSGSPFACELGVDAVAVDPTGRFLFAVAGMTGDMWTYSISSSGFLAPLQGTPNTMGFGGHESSSVTVTPTGDFVYVTNSEPPMFLAGVYGFLFDSASGDTISTMQHAVSVDGLANTSAIDPTGKFLLATGTMASATLGGVTVFSIDALTGALTPVSPDPPNFVLVGHDPAGVITDHSGKFVYIPNTADAAISAFSLDGTGALSEIPGSPFPSGGNGSINGPIGIATDFAGQFVYVCNASNDVSVFRIDQTSGALAPVAGSPFPDSGNGPRGIVFVHKP